jgi:hypothetical protein
VFSIPYDYCLRPEASQDARCDTGGKERLPDAGSLLYFTTPFGSVLEQAPRQIDANQTLAFSLIRRDHGDTSLALLDESDLRVESVPAAELDVDVSADRHFFTVTPKSSFASALGKLQLTVRGKVLVDPTRTGLKLEGGRVLESFTSSFDFDVNPGNGPEKLAMPTAPGDPSAAFELYRMAVPLPTVMPSYNQIGFDSLHYLVGMVKGNGVRGVGWIIGGKLNDADTTIVDADTQVMFPVEVTHERGLITLKNQDGFVVNAMNFDMPFDSFRWSGRVGGSVAATGTSEGAPTLHVKTQCKNIPTYGPFMTALGLCSPSTDLLNVFGGGSVRPFAGGVATMPTGIGTLAITREGGLGFGRITNPRVRIDFGGSSLVAKDHAFGVLVVDADSGKPMAHKYGLATTKVANADGTIQSVELNYPQAKAPANAVVYLMVDTYPAASYAIKL